MTTHAQPYEQSVSLASQHFRSSGKRTSCRRVQLRFRRLSFEPSQTQITTSSPRRARAAATFDPMNPAPPVVNRPTPDTPIRIFHPRAEAFRCLRYAPQLRLSTRATPTTRGVTIARRSGVKIARRLTVCRNQGIPRACGPLKPMATLEQLFQNASKMALIGRFIRSLQPAFTSP